MMHYTIEGLKAIAKVKNIPVGVGFYASDVGLNSGEINSLAHNHFIVETGRYKEEFVHLYDDHYKKVRVKEWTINSKNMEVLGKRLYSDIKELKELIMSLEI